MRTISSHLRCTTMLHPGATTGTVCPVPPPFPRATLHASTGTTVPLATFNQTDHDCLPDQSCKFDPEGQAHWVPTLVGTVRQKCALGGLVRASFLTQSRPDARWRSVNARSLFTIKRLHGYLLVSLFQATLWLLASTGPMLSQWSLLRLSRLKSRHLDGPWTKDPKQLLLYRMWAIPMMMSRIFPHSRLRLARVRRQMISRMPLWRVADLLDIGSGHIKFPQSTIPVW